MGHYLTDAEARKQSEEITSLRNQVTLLRRDLEARNAQLVKALTKIQEIIRQPDWAETYSIADLNRAWAYIGEISAKALAANTTEGE